MKMIQFNYSWGIIKLFLGKHAMYTSRYNAYVDRYEKAKARYDSLAANRQDKLAGAKAVERFMAVLDERDDPLTEFDRHLWIMTVDYATVHRDGTITFRFYDGTEITK